jgi:putative endonuclease
MDRLTLRELGAAGEAAAAAWLEGNGYEIIARNVRTRFGELDLVARQRGVLVFVEVKSRTSDRFGHPAEALVARKRQRLTRLAASFMRGHAAEVTEIRFDAVAVYLDPMGRVEVIEHIPNAFGSL